MSIERYAGDMYFLGVNDMRAVGFDVTCNEGVRREKSQQYAELSWQPKTKAFKEMLDENFGELRTALARITAYERN